MNAVDLSSGFQTRPYTIRKGDSLYQIAKKRGLKVDQVKALNPALNDKTENYLVPGETILLPAGKLSQRDTEILAGIGSGKTRIYPVRKGETIETVAANRKIPLDKLKALNPTIDLQKLKGGENILLPSGYYTTREKEMLSVVMPESALSFTRASAALPVVLLIMLAGVGVTCYKSTRFQAKWKEIMGTKEEPQIIMVGKPKEE